MTLDPGPLARLELVKADPDAPSEVFRLLTDDSVDETKPPPTLRSIATSWRVPKGRFVEWFTTKHAALYDAALKVKAADCADAAAKAALDATPETVQVAKLRADVAFKLASRWDRERYGEKAVTQVAVVPLADPGFLLRCGELLNLAAKGELRLEREVRTVDEMPAIGSKTVTVRTNEI